MKVKKWLVTILCVLVGVLIGALILFLVLWGNEELRFSVFPSSGFGDTLDGETSDDRGIVDGTDGGSVHLPNDEGNGDNTGNDEGDGDNTGNGDEEGDGKGGNDNNGDIVKPDGDKPHEHKYSTAWSSNNVVHWHYCIGCDSQSDFGFHTYQDGVCTVCAAIEHVHEFSTEWVQGTTEHYHECDSCGEKQDNAAHTYQNGACTVCGKSDHVHDLSKWWQTVTEHYHYCLGCGLTTDLGEHTYQDGVCTVCGAVEHVHEFSTEWVQGYTEHYHKCVGAGVGVCSETRDNAAHTYQDGECTVCGKVQHEHSFSSTWLISGSVHYRVCNGCDKQEIAGHTYQDGVCTVCGHHEQAGVLHPCNCDCTFGGCTEKCTCMTTGVCMGNCGCDYSTALSCGCACSGCECAYGYECIGDETCGCTCHDKPNKDDGLSECSYFFGDEFGYRCDEDSFKVAVTFESSTIRDFFDVSVTFDMDSGCVSFSIIPIYEGFELWYFSVSASAGGYVESLSDSGWIGDVEYEGSFYIFDDSYDSCMEDDGHYYIVYVYVYCDMSDFVAWEFDSTVEDYPSESEYKPVIYLCRFLMDGVELYIHSNFEYVISSVSGDGVEYSYDPDNPFGGFYRFTVESGNSFGGARVVLSSLKCIENGSDDSENDLSDTPNPSIPHYDFSGYLDSWVSVGSAGIEYRVYYISNGYVKIDVCVKDGGLCVSYGEFGRVPVGSYDKLCTYGGYICVGDSDTGVYLYRS